MKAAFALYLKEVKRNIISVLIIALTVFLTVVLTAGMLSHAFLYKKSAEDYFDANKMWDIKITSNLGFTREDVIAVSGASGVKKATAIIAADTNAAVNSVGNYGTKIYGINFDGVAANPDSEVSAPRLIKGSYPTDANSCVVVVSNALESNVKIGDTVSLNNNTGYAAQTSFTVTGLVSTPEYASFIKTENSVNDSGTQMVIFVRDSAFSPDAPFTEINLILDGSESLDSFSREYTIFVNTASGPVGVVAHEREQKRGTGLNDEYVANIEKLQKQYDYIKNEGEKELKELTDIIKGITKKTDAEDKRLASVKVTLDIQKAELDNLANDASYQQKKQEYDEALLKYERAKENNELNKGTAKKLESDKKSIEKSTAKKLEEAKKNLDNALNNSPTDYAQKWVMSFRDDNASFKSVAHNATHIASVFTALPVIILLMGLGVVLCIVYFAVKRRNTEAQILKTDYVFNKKTQICLTATLTFGAVLGGVLGIIFAPRIIPRAIIAVLEDIYNIPFDSIQNANGFSPIVAIILIAAVLLGTFIFIRRGDQIDGKKEFNYPVLPNKIPVYLRVLIRNILKEKYIFAALSLLLAALNICLLFALSVGHSTAQINTKQYANIEKYDLSVELKPLSDYKANEPMMAYLGDKEYLAITRDTAKITVDTANKFITVIVPENAEKLGEFISAGKLKPDSVIITKDFASKYGIKKGSELSVVLGTVSAKLTVTDITKNYVGDYMYIHPQKYEQLKGDKLLADTLLIKNPKIDNIADEIAAIENTGIMYSVTEKHKLNTEKTDKLSAAIYFPCVIIGAVLVFLLSVLLYSKRDDDIKALRNSGCKAQYIASYFALETAVVCIAGALLGILLSLLTHLPLCLMQFEGIGKLSFIALVPLVKTIAVSVTITAIAALVNIGYRFIKK